MQPTATSPEDHTYALTDDVKQQYAKFFLNLDPAGNTQITAEQALPFFQKSNLPMEVLSKIWKLADVNQDNYLSSDEFCVAFHLIVLVSRRGVALPTVRKVLH